METYSGVDPAPLTVLVIGHADDKTPRSSSAHASAEKRGHAKAVPRLQD